MRITRLETLAEWWPVALVFRCDVHPERATTRNSCPFCASTEGVTRDTWCVHASAAAPLAQQLDWDFNAPSLSHTRRKKIMSLILIIKHRGWRKLPDWADFWKLGKLDARSSRDSTDEKTEEAGCTCIFVRLNFSAGNLKIRNKE